MAEGKIVISPEREAEILRLFHAERWTVGTIGRQLSLHHSTVERVLRQAGVIPSHAPVRGSIVDSYLPFIRAILEKYPTLAASRVFEMVRQRGYPGRSDHFRHIIAGLRPRKVAEAYLRVRTLPGEQAQVDWGHFGRITIGRARRHLVAFVMVLSFSRMTFLRFYLDAQMPNFLRGHVDAFEHFGGVARVLLYDNLKSAVLERNGEAIRFHPKLLELKKHYRFDPRPVAVARGNEKGRVERKIRDIRTSFFAARQYTNLEDLNTQALEWCTGLAADRPCPEDKTRRVRDVFADERSRLLPLPDTPFDTTERVEVVVRKQPYVRFDLNDYSIPFNHIQRTLVVLADLKTIRILDGLETIATHERSFDHGAQVEKSEHINQLRSHKRHAKARSALDYLHRAAPSVAEFLHRAVDRGVSLAKLTAQLLDLLDRYGPRFLDEALREAIRLDAPHIGAVQQILETNRKARQDPPPLSRQVCDDPRIRDLIVQPHDIKNYSHLMEVHDDQETIE